MLQVNLTDVNWLKDAWRDFFLGKGYACRVDNKSDWSKRATNEGQRLAKHIIRLRKLLRFPTRIGFVPSINLPISAQIIWNANIRLFPARTSLKPYRRSEMKRFAWGKGIVEEYGAVELTNAEFAIATIINRRENLPKLIDLK